LEGFAKVARQTDIRAGGAKTIQVGGRAVALFRLGESYYATDNDCLHLGGPLGEGALEGRLVTCPWHDWQFDVSTGASLQSSSLFLKCFEVKVLDGDVYVSLQPKTRPSG
jgi:nitrite reductase (NADH) small subunit